MRGAGSHRRRTAIAVLCAGIVALTAYPALADDPPDEEPGSDPPISFEAPTPAAGSVLTGVQTLRVRAGADEFTALESFRLSIVSDDPAIPPFARVVAELAPRSFDGKQDQTLQFSWDTNRLTPHNGTYKVVATGKACDFGNCSFDSSENTRTVNGLRVNNSPAAPQSVQAAMQGTTPVVTWNAGAEPDIRGYLVLRSTAGQAAQPVGSAPAGGSFRDSCANPCPPGATLAYQVVAVRNSPVIPDGIASAASPTASVVIPAAGPITAAAPPPAPGPALAAPPPTVSGQRAAPPAVPKAAAPVLPATPTTMPPPPVPEPAPPTAQPMEPQAVPAAAPASVTPSPTAEAIRERLEMPKVSKVRYIAGLVILLALATVLARSLGLALSRNAGRR